MPDRIVKRILMVDTDMPILESQHGYARKKSDALMELVMETVRTLKCDGAEVFWSTGPKSADIAFNRD